MCSALSYNITIYATKKMKYIEYIVCFILKYVFQHGVMILGSVSKVYICCQFAHVWFSDMTHLTIALQCKLLEYFGRNIQVVILLQCIFYECVEHVILIFETQLLDKQIQYDIINTSVSYDPMHILFIYKGCEYFHINRV